MKLIKSSVSIIEEKDPYKMIELAGRTCYKSEDKITKDSCKEFADRMIKLGHGAILEHGTIYLTLPQYLADIVNEASDYIYEHYLNNKYSRVNMVEEMGDRIYYVTTNLRVLVENNWLDDLRFQSKPTEHHIKRITAKFICDRGVSHEIVRHRVFSFAQESTRYCNYNKDKFDNELTFIIPTWLKLPQGSYAYWDGDWCDVEKLKIVHYDADEKTAINTFLYSLYNAEINYTILTNSGWKPQQARQVLPNALKTEIVVTGFEDDWNHFFELRCSKAAHPDIKKLADELKELFVNKC